MQKTCVIFNPAARCGRSSKVLKKLQLEEKGCVLMPTEGPLHATELVRNAIAEQFEVVVAAGGDGTVNEVINGLANTCITPDAKTRLPMPTLGVLPLGTVNVFARELGIPLNPRGAWDVIERGRSKQIDLLRANHFWFVQMAGVGLDAQIARNTDLSLKARIGFLAYIVHAFKELRAPLPRLRATTDVGVAEGSVVLVGNGRRYAGWFNMWPKARLDNGRFDVVVWNGSGIFSALHFAQQAFGGLHVTRQDVKYYSCTYLKVESLENAAPFELEGEVLGQTPVEFFVIPFGIRVIAP